MTIITVYLAFYVFVKAVRDVLDKTPTSDDTLFEKFVTFLGKLAALLTTGKRPQA
jgi:hypothetical protein